MGGELLLSVAPVFALLVMLAVVLRHRMKSGREANERLQARMDEQADLGERHLKLLERQIAELKRIADALERKGPQ